MPRHPVFALVLLAVAALCGCAGPPSPAARLAGSATVVTSAPVPRPPPTLDLTRAELLAALPEGRELFPWRIQVRCGRKAVCGRLAQGRGAYLLAHGEDSRGVPGYLLVAGIRWRDQARARSAARSAREAARASYAGRIERPPQRLGEGRYRYGFHGRGSVRDRDHAGWTGYERADTVRIEHLDGRTSAPFREVAVLLQRGRYTLQVEVRAPRTALGDQTARAQVEEQLAALVDRLERLGGPASQERRVP